MLNRRLSIRLSTFLISLTTLVLISSVGVPDRLMQKAAAADRGPAEPSVDARPVPAKKAVLGAEETAPKVAPRKPVWPEAGQAEVTIPEPGEVAQPGKLPVKLGPVSGSRLDKVKVETLPPAAVQKLGGAGVAARLIRADGGTAPGKARAVFSYAGFRDAFGGQFVSRLQLLRLPACVLEEPRPRSCVARPTVVPSVNDVQAGTLTAEVEVAPTVAAPAETQAPTLGRNRKADAIKASGAALAAQLAAGAVYLLAGDLTGPDGNWGATDLKPSGTWQAGTSGGDFDYDLPLPMPASPGGFGPDLSLQYSASSVDGQGAWTNNQSGVAGVGWDLSRGYIERRFRRCDVWTYYDDNTAELVWIADESKVGRAYCWESPNENATGADRTQSELVLSAGGRSAQIVKAKVGNVEEWKTVPDFGWKIEQVAGGADGNAYWRVTDREGQVWRFGYTKDAQWQVPYVGDESGEPCFDRYWNNFIPPTCTGVWRWNMDQEIDRNENVIDYSYARETNYFCLPSCAHEVYEVLPYDRGGFLASASWGHNTQVSGSTPSARMTFATATRGGDDVPTDLHCAQAAGCLNDAIAFYSTRRLTTIQTESRDPASGVWGPAGRLDFTHTWVYQRTDQGLPWDAAMWLDTVQQTGQAAEPEITLPPLNFDAVMLAGRMDYISNSDWQDQLSWRMVPRIAAIGNGMGGRIEVTYGQADPCGGAKGRDGSNYMSDKVGDCHQVDMGSDPEQGYEAWTRYYKQLATKVVERDMVAGSPDNVYSYEFLGAPRWANPIQYAEPDLAPAGSDWRGYGQVRTVQGSGTDPSAYSVTTRTFLRGSGLQVTDFEGNSVTDAALLQGQVLQEQAWRMTSLSPRAYTELQSTRYEYKITNTGGWPGTLDPAFVLRTRERAREQIAAGGWRYTNKTTVHNSDGLPATINDLGQDGVSSDNSCTTMRYARNVSAGNNYTALPSVIERRAGDDCVAGNLYSRSVILYDGGSDPATNAPSDGNVTETRSYLNETTASVAKATFDNYGRALSTTDALSKTTTTQYAPAVGWPYNGVTTTNPLGHKVTTKSSHLHGQTTSLLDANQKLMEVDYDALGRSAVLWGTGEPRSGSTPTATVKYELSAEGTLGQPDEPAKTVMRKLLSGTGSTAKYTTSSSYEDGFGRLREVQAASPQGGRVVAVTAYDPRGLTMVNALAVHNTDAPGSGLLNPAFESLPQWTKTTYDALRRTTAAIDYNLASEFRRTTTAYPGMDRVEVSPPVGGKVATVVDVAGRTVKNEQWSGSSTHYDTTYAYNLAGKLTSLTDANGNVRTFSYDWLDRRTATKAPDSGSVSTGYDAAGRITWNVDGNGTKTSFAYDDLGRKTSQWAGEVGTGTKLAEWVYDTLAKGQSTSSTRYAGSQAYVQTVTGYDDAYRPLGSKVTVPASEGALAGEYVSAVTYDRAGNTLTRTVPAIGGLPAETLTLGYSDLALPKSLTSSLGGNTVYVKDTSYTATARIAERTYGGNGQVKRSFTWDNKTGWLNRLTTTAKADTSSPAMVQDDQFRYNAAGVITQVLDATAAAGASLGQRECFGYDDMTRLIHAFTTTQVDCTAGADGQGIDPYSQRYTYDAVGNIKSLQDGGVTATYGYPAPGVSAVRPNAVTSITRPSRTDTYAYDNAGQLTSRTVDDEQSTFTWNQLGQMEKAVVGGAETSMVYDANGERIIRRDPGGTTLYLGDMEVRSSGGTVKATRYYNSPDGALVGVRTTDGFRWTASGLHGSTQLAIDDATGAVARERYLPYGQRRGGDDLPFTDRGFLGKTEDGSTDLVYLSARYYDPATAKFASPDPMLDPDAPQWTNPYGYAADNPIGLSDPDGLIPDHGGGSGDSNRVLSAIDSILGALPSEGVRNKFLERWRSRLAEHLRTHLNAEALQDDRLRTQQEFFLALSICEEIGFRACGSDAIEFFFAGVWARHDLDELMGSDKGKVGGKASMFARFKITPGKGFRKDVPSAAGNRSYITYVIKNKRDQVVYVGKASGPGTPEDVLRGRLTKKKDGHDHYHPDLGDKYPEIVDVYKSKAAMSGGEQFYIEAYREMGATLRNVDEALSWRAERRKKSLSKLDAFFLEKMFRGQL